MKRLFILWAIVLIFGYGLGSYKNNTLNFAKWGFYSSKYVSIWWTIMGGSALFYCGVRSAAQRIMADHHEEKKAKRDTL